MPAFSCTNLLCLRVEQKHHIRGGEHTAHSVTKCRRAKEQSFAYVSSRHTNGLIGVFTQLPEEYPIENILRPSYREHRTDCCSRDSIWMRTNFFSSCASNISTNETKPSEYFPSHRLEIPYFGANAFDLNSSNGDAEAALHCRECDKNLHSHSTENGTNGFGWDRLGLKRPPLTWDRPFFIFFFLEITEPFPWRALVHSTAACTHSFTPHRSRKKSSMHACAERIRLAIKMLRKQSTSWTLFIEVKEVTRRIDP